MQRKVSKMKSKAKSTVMILITLGIIFALSPVINNGLNFNASNSNKNPEYGDNISLDTENLKLSAVSGKIHIDNNWSTTESTYSWCTGSGTSSDPYIIEDLIIDGGGNGFQKGSCILIENSNVFFRIENCTVYNSGIGEYDAGIKLSSVNNGQLINNNASNNRNGIWLSSSDKNTVSGNTVNDNRDSRIIILPWDLPGRADGIYLIGCNNNTISGNTANNNDVGIYLAGCNNNKISGNMMNKCGLILDGWYMRLILSDWYVPEEPNSHNIDNTNLVNGKPLYYYANEVNLGANDFINAGQVILFNCSNSLISNLNVSYSSMGISLFYCNNNTISGNSVNHNNMNGIDLNFGGNNTITDNNASYNNDDGIYLRYSDSNSLTGNNASYNNDEGIIFFSSINNSVSGNTANNNQDGIYLSTSQYNTVSGNYVNSNYNGIKLQGGNHNMISGNLVNYNYNGIELYKSDENNIIENTINNNNRGIYLYSYEICVYGNCELTDLSKCNYISDNSFSNNSKNILGTQIGCNPGGGGGGGGGIPGYNLFFLLGTVSVVAIIISIKLKKFNK